jgi:hypothetical protein
LAVIYDAQGRGIDTNNPLPIKHSASDIIQPVEVQSHYASTVQTHNAVSVPANNSSRMTTFIDCDGFDKVSITLSNDSATASYISLIWSNDGVSNHGLEDNLASNALQQKAYLTDVKSRYLKVQVANTDTVAHTISAWAYLKA